MARNASQAIPLDAATCATNGSQPVSAAMNDRAYLDEAIGAEEAGKLFGLSAPSFLRYRACLPSFPAAVNNRPKAWIRGEVLEWRENHRAERFAA